MEVYCQIKMSK